MAVREGCAFAVRATDIADEALSRVRVYLRLAARWDWLSTGQYEHVSAMVGRDRKASGWLAQVTPA